MQKIEAEFFGPRESRPRLTGDRDLDLPNIANSIDQAWINAKKMGAGSDFLKEALGVGDSLAKTAPEYLLAPGRTVEKRRQPGLGEAVKETTKRLIFVESLVGNLPSSVKGLIVGGSLSYGRFYNVRGQPNPSDLDIFLIVEEDFFREGKGVEIVNADNGFDIKTSTLFPDRLKVFTELFDSKEAHLMSIKSPVDDYLASIKIVPTRTFEHEFSTVLEEIGETTEDREFIVRDYKQELYPARLFVQYNFLHEPFEFKIESDYPTTLGAVTPIPCAMVKDGRFYTGQHQNHVLPKFEVEVDSDGTTNNTLQKFKTQLLKRRNMEEVIFQRELRVINCHDRRDILSPFVVSEME